MICVWHSSCKEILNRQSNGSKITKRSGSGGLNSQIKVSGLFVYKIERVIDRPKTKMETNTRALPPKFVVESPDL